VSGGADSSGSAAGRRARGHAACRDERRAREERKLVAAVEPFQKLEEGRQGTHERTSKAGGGGEEENRGDSAAFVELTQQRKKQFQVQWPDEASASMTCNMKDNIVSTAASITSLLGATSYLYMYICGRVVIYALFKQFRMTVSSFIETPQKTQKLAIGWA
jgi:hypothetical protein